MRQNSWIYTYRKPAYVLVVLLSILLSWVGSPALAASSSGAIAQSYQTTSAAISQGSLLSLTATGSTTVAPANTVNSSSLVGIATSAPLIELSSGARNSIQVAVGGTNEALVSDVNGPVYAGDKITASPVSGIGMKATTASEIVGVAQANLTSVKTVTKFFTGTDGKQVSVNVGLLPIAINVGYYSAASQGSLSAYIPPFLQNLADSIAGKVVSPFRVLIGTATLLLGFVTIVIMLYTGIRSGVISLGRNPLAANALRRGMVDILVTAMGILIVTGVIVAAAITT
ncbi:MAG TPA: hypothetical protein VMB52_03915 [Verrucomicrobiae bacterium]|nr:hypothetical protein [Verrucomicrobiae bacterium]